MEKLTEEVKARLRGGKVGGREEIGKSYQLRRSVF